MVDYGGALKKPFQDITKLIIGIVLSIIPILSFFATGYLVETAKKTLAKDNNLPEWTNWGGLFVSGLSVFVISIIYFIPAIIVAFIGLAPVIGAVMGTITAAMASGDVAAISSTAIMNAALPAIMSSMASAMVFFLIAAILAFVAGFLLPMAQVFYAKEGFGGAFKVGSILKACLTGNYIVSWIIIIVIGMILSGILAILPIVGSAIATFYIGIASYTIFAQVLLAKGK